MTREQMRDAALATPECVAYKRTGKVYQQASKDLHAAREAYHLAGMADQRAETAYHSTPEFQALKNQWREK